jgi:hypothetical protein
MRVQFNGIPASARLQHLLSPYNIKIISKYGILIIQRGSLSAIRSIRLYPQKYSQDNPVIADIGPYCDFSECALIIGGEHTNTSSQFTGSPHISGYLQVNGHYSQPSSKGPMTIGANSVFSFGSIILSGTNLGANSLIAAGAVLTGKYPSNSVIAGVPGRKIKARFKDPPNFWQLTDGYICKLLTGELREVQTHMHYKDHDKYFIFYSNPDEIGRLGTLEWRGIEYSGNHINLPDIPVAIKNYMNQLSEETITIDDELFLNNSIM